MISKLSFNALWKYLAPIVVGLIVFAIGAPEGLSSGAWIFVSIFAALVVGLILEPMPPAFIGMIAITLAVLFRVGMPVVEKPVKSSQLQPVRPLTGVSAVFPMPSYG